MINGKEMVEASQRQFNKCYFCDYMELISKGIATGLACNVCIREDYVDNYNVDNKCMTCNNIKKNSAGFETCVAPLCIGYDHYEPIEVCEWVTDNMVNSPPHYNQYQMEVIDVIAHCLTPEQYKGYLLGNMLKYRMRAGLKDKDKRAEDLDKSNWYQDKL